MPMLEDVVYAVDYETYYAKDYSLRTMPTRAYVYHELFDAYLVAVAGSDGFKWVGHPKDFNWAMLEGKVVLHHNASFDALVSKRLVELGVIPDIKFAAIHDTADLAAFLQYPRALKDYAKFVLGMRDLADAGKKAREKMKGLPASELANDPEILEYATNDVRICLHLWQTDSHQWPVEERQLSRLNREACFRGVAVDVEYVEACYSRLAAKLYDAGRAIPWDWPEGKTPLARRQIIDRCENTITLARPLTEEERAEVVNVPEVSDKIELALMKLWKRQLAAERLDPGLVPEFSRVRVTLSADTNDWVVSFYMWYPASFAKDDEDCMRWEDTFADQYEWIRAVRDWRRINTLLGRVKHLRDYTFSGIYYPQIKYFGARTGRFSGDGMFNMLNMPRAEMFCDLDADKKPIPNTGCDLRKCFVARPGHKLVMSDYAQIEARALVAVVNDEKLLTQLRNGMSIYEAHARATMGWTGGVLKKENPMLYQLAKARVLGAGYGCGAGKFAVVASLLTGGEVTLTHAQAKETIEAYRASNPGIVSLWKKLDAKIRAAGAQQSDLCTLRLHSGRELRYWKPRFRIPKSEEGAKEPPKPQLMAMFAKGDPGSYRKAYGGLLTENCIQALCRDILRDGWISLAEKGYEHNVLWTIYDEFVGELPEDHPVEEWEKAILDVRDWAKFIPIAIESNVGPHYMK